MGHSPKKLINKKLTKFWEELLIILLSIAMKSNKLENYHPNSNLWPKLLEVSMLYLPNLPVLLKHHQASLHVPSNWPLKKAVNKVYAMIVKRNFINALIITKF